jgi:30S ribosomal protein S31
MGKGDKKTRKGKIHIGSTGNSRPRKKAKRKASLAKGAANAGHGAEAPKKKAKAAPKKKAKKD